MTEFQKVALTLPVLIPLVAALVLLLFYKPRHEAIHFRLAGIFALLHLLSIGVIFGIWATESFKPMHINMWRVFHFDFYTFSVELLWDHVSAAFMATTGFCGGLIVFFSRSYMHREAGFARFFSSVFLLLGGISLLSMADNLDNFFAGWELIGVASFVLVGFYWQRISSVENALKIFAVYRVGDLGLLLGAWLAHELAHHHHIGFHNLSDFFVTPDIPSLFDIRLMAVAILVGAAAKSAQYPFSFYIPRAMEGPTPSSAIFYGALSIHAGVLLLLRTEAIWGADLWCRVAVGAWGFLSAVIASACSRTQSSIKGQLAYASVTQVGIMLVELSFGLHLLVLIHFVMHALLRCFQILVSPSIVARMLQIQAQPAPGQIVLNWSLLNLLPQRLRYSVYVFALQDGYAEYLLQRLVIGPIGNIAALFRERPKILLVFLLTDAGICVVLSHAYGWSLGWCAWFLCAQALFSLWALVEIRSHTRVFDLIGCSYLCCSLAVLPFKPYLEDSIAYLLAVLPFWLIARMLVRRLDVRYRLRPGDYSGLMGILPKSMLMLFLVVAAISAIPPSPVFFAEDLLLHSFTAISKIAAVPVAICIAINTFVVVRGATRMALGPGVRMP